MQKLNLVIFLVMLSVSLKAQHQVSTASDSIMAVKTDLAEQAALMYPRLRQFSISHEENGFGTIRSKMGDKELFEGKFRSSRTSVNFNMPVLQRENNKLVVNAGAINQFYDLSEIRSFDPQTPIYDGETNMQMISTGLTYIRTATIFGKSATFAASGGVLFNNDFSRNQLSFTGIANINLIQRENTRLSLGGALLLNPASPVPFFVTANYYHKFKGLSMDLMVDLPYRVALRKEVTKKTSLTFFNELGGANSFFDFKNSTPTVSSEKLTLSSLEIKSGLMAEYRVSRKAVISLSAGSNYMVNSRIRENNSKPNDYFVENKHKPVPFVQVGFSLLPFWKGLNF
ncbi:DUF6268 family outer membrane beta-barrel protein [Sphingobacterium sp. HSC-15S19]|uniref:DUF6268 family outer membrane beta-barrel protein n=1 Tax=Sphingobacterium TaxID=28453 RepID=UPI003D21C9AA